MTRLQRLGLLLLGLLVVAGAVHAPLHGPGQDCGLMTLCSGVVVLMVAAGVALLLYRSSKVVLRRACCAPVPAGSFCRAAQGRAPPQ